MINFKWAPLPTQVMVRLVSLTQLLPWKTNGESTIQEKTTREGRTEKVKGIPILKTLDYSFLAKIFEVGDAIQYNLGVLCNWPEGSDLSLVTDDVVTSIDLEPDGKKMSVQLNNSSKIISSLHLV